MGEELHVICLDMEMEDMEKRCGGPDFLLYEGNETSQYTLVGWLMKTVDHVPGFFMLSFFS